jgi:hypothetical protein
MCDGVGEAQNRWAEALDALAATDPAGLPDTALHDLVTALQRDESRFAAVRARAIAAWDARRLWVDDGSKSASARLARECGLAPMSARREVKRARKLRTMPCTAEALRNGKYLDRPRRPSRVREST